jgi:voltage-gated potassium channel Kch
VARARSSLLWQTLEWPLIWVLALAAFVLGAVGFARYFAAAGDSRSLLDVGYLTLQLFVLQSGHVAPPVPWQLEVARLLAPGVAAYTASKALAVLFQEQLQLVRLHFMRNQAVICGLGRKGMHLVQGFRSRGIPVVVIEKNPENDQLDRCRTLGAAVLLGDARDPKLLARARLQRMSCLVAVCGADAVNVEVAHAAREQAAARRRARQRPRPAASCVVHILEPELCDLLHAQEVGLPISFFNPFEIGARAMLDKFFAVERAGDGGGLPHLLVVGAGKMGESLIVEAARRWWTSGRASGARLRLTVIDRMAHERITSLSLRYPRLQEACEPRAVEIDVCSAEYYRGEFLAWSGARCDVTTAFVCLDNESLALSAALSLHQRLAVNPIPIIVRTEEDAGLAQLLCGEGGRCTYPNVFGFGLLDRTCTPELVLGARRETLARAAHRSYVATRAAQGDSRARNPSMAPWDELPPEFQESSRRQADNISVKLNAVGCEIVPRRDWGAPLFAFEPAELELLARAEHDRYVEERRAEGWRFAPGPKNLAKKTNPTLVPWEQLSEADKDIDRETVRELPKFLAEAGFAIRRLESR